jgi:hypothetical protein
MVIAPTDRTQVDGDSADGRGGEVGGRIEDVAKDRTPKDRSQVDGDSDDGREGEVGCRIQDVGR